MRYIKQKDELTDLSIILKSVCEYFHIDELDLFKRTRNHEIIRPRQWFHYFARTLNPDFIISLDFIAQYYSDVTGVKFNHCTVIHSNKTIKGFIESYKESQMIKNDILFLIKLKTEKVYSIPLTGNCAEQPFKINRYHESKNLIGSI